MLLFLSCFFAVWVVDEIEGGGKGRKWRDPSSSVMCQLLLFNHPFLDHLLLSSSWHWDYVICIKSPFHLILLFLLFIAEYWNVLSSPNLPSQMIVSVNILITCVMPCITNEYTEWFFSLNLVSFWVKSLFLAVNLIGIRNQTMISFVFGWSLENLKNFSLKSAVITTTLEAATLRLKRWITSPSLVVVERVSSCCSIH